MFISFIAHCYLVCVGEPKIHVLRKFSAFTALLIIVLMLYFRSLDLFFLTTFKFVLLSPFLLLPASGNDYSDYDSAFYTYTLHVSDITHFSLSCCVWFISFSSSLPGFSIFSLIANSLFFPQFLHPSFTG